MQFNSTAKLRPWLGSLGCALMLAGTGCASSEADTARELDKLRTEVASLRGQAGALTMRIEGLERRRQRAAESEPASAALASTRSRPRSDSRPELEVVTLTPSEPVAAPHEEPPPVSALELEGNKAFKEAKNLFDKRSIEPAMTAFSLFVSRYPDHPEADSAIFHRGLCLAIKGDHKKAAEQFEAVAVAAGPRELTADALFELARSKERLGDAKSARAARERIKSDFPQSAAAKRLPR